tara:strand:- start:491 stop:1789 length:1299 start_codon:yes stop_codon:yes gene_type:complete
MTITEFLLIHTTPEININFSQRINILYNTVGGSDEGRIDAITVTATAFSVDGQTDPVSTNITNILEQVEEISFTFDGTTYVLTVVESAYYSDSNAFFYFKVESNALIPNIFDANISTPLPNGGDFPDGQVVFHFHPFLNDINFSLTDHNVLFNNADNFRRSSDKLEADRNIGSTIPSNFSAILSTSASKAEVQDSFYTDTGLTNARYDGTLLTPADLGGIPPSLTVKEFAGVIHPRGTSQDVACGIIGSPVDEITVSLLHSGQTILPTFRTLTSGIAANGALTTNDVSLDYTYTAQLSGQMTPSIDIGDILTTTEITSSLFEGNFELMRVLEHNISTQKIILQRRYFSGSNPQLGGSGTISDGTEFFKVDKVDVVQVDEFDTKLDSVGSSIVFVRNGNYLIHTDEFGTVFSSSICPPPLLLGIDDDTPGGND